MVSSIDSVDQTTRDSTSLILDHPRVVDIDHLDLLDLERYSKVHHNDPPHPGQRLLDDPHHETSIPPRPRRPPSMSPRGQLAVPSRRHGHPVSRSRKPGRDQGKRAGDGGSPELETCGG